MAYNNNVRIANSFLSAICLAVCAMPAKAASAVSTTPTTNIPAAPVNIDTTQQHWQTITVQAGDNLADIFTRLGLSQQQLQNILAIKPINDTLSDLQPDEKLQFLVGPNHVVQQINYPVNLLQNLQITREGDTYKTSVIQQEPQIKLKTIAGDITTSFAKDAIKAHLHPKQVKEFMHIFSDEINFNRDVKKGDHFSVIYETYYSADDNLGSGDIVAAEYINKGKIYRAIRFADAQGHYNYYSPEGLNLQRAFVREPVSFRKISSVFSTQRVDPVSRQFVHPHKGVDFAAPIGTPIRATGDGKIIFAGVKNGYGNTIIISHGNRYRTLYAHIDHFAKGIHQGMVIQTGQLIGYVGATGRVTGPHLHYEFLVNGKANNPLTVVFPRAKAIAVAYRNKFVEKTKQLIALLEPPVTSPTIRLAANDSAVNANKVATATVVAE